jgi:tetratricopeptide (TPR) repeat protein
VFSNAPGDCDRALARLERSLALDPGFLPAHATAAWCLEQRYLRSGLDPADRTAALRHADIVLGVNADDPQAASIGAFVRANLTRDYDGAIEALDRALGRNPNSALAWGFSALVSAHSERHERAVEHARKALRLSPPNDPLCYHPYCALALTYLFAGGFADAVACATLAIRANPGFSVPYAYLAAGHVGLGDIDAARLAVRRLLEVGPRFSVSGFVRMELFRPPLTAALAAALTRAGLPEDPPR